MMVKSRRMGKRALRHLGKKLIQEFPLSSSSGATIVLGSGDSIGTKQNVLRPLRSHSYSGREGMQTSHFNGACYRNTWHWAVESILT